MLNKKILVSAAITLLASIQNALPALSNPVSLINAHERETSLVRNSHTDVIKHPKLIILALHGMAMHGSTFDALKETLAAENILVIAPDLPGYGNQCLAKSAKCAFRGETSLGFVEQQIMLLKETYPKVSLILLGESLGGALAIEYAARNPETVDGLILAAPALSFKTLSVVKLLPNLLLSVVNPGAKIQLKNFIEQNSSDNLADAQLVLQDSSSRKTTSFRELLRIRRFLSRAKSEVSNLSSNLPILVLHGSADRIISPQSSEFLVKHSNSSNKKLEVFCGVGHLLLEVQRPRKEVLVTIETWLNDFNRFQSSPTSVFSNLKCRR